MIAYRTGHSQFELDIGNAHFQTSDHMPRLHLMTFNLATGEASRKRVSSVVGDFPHFPQHLTGAPSACRCSMELIVSEAYQMFQQPSIHSSRCDQRTF